jgi:hypothetical protein
VATKIDWLTHDSWERAGLLFGVIFVGFGIYVIGLKVLGRRLKDVLAPS